MLQLLETFCAVADAGSLTRASERLHLTQPAITRQIRTLERQLGAVLLTRTPQGVALMGLTILPASAVQDELDSGRLAGASFADWPEAARVIHLLVRANGRPPRPVVVFTELLTAAYGGRSAARPASTRPSRPGVGGTE